MSAAQSQNDVSLLLPFYVNGTLSPEERQQVEDARAKSPEVAAEIEALTQIRTKWQADHDAMGDGSPGEAGLQRLLSDIDVMERAVPAPEPITTPKPANTNAPLVRRLAALAAAALVGAVLSLTWVQSTGDSEGAQMVSGPAFDAAEGPVITVRFRDDAILSRISAVLDKEGLVIVDGPSASGLYRLGALDADLSPNTSDALRAHEDIFEVVDDPE